MQARGGFTFLAKQALLPQTLAATTNGNVIDVQGAEECTFILNVGTFAFDGTNNLTVTVQEGDAANGSDMANIAAGAYLSARRSDGATWDRLMDNAADDDSVFTITVAKSDKRYRRVVITEAGIVSVIMGVEALLSGLRHAQAGATQVP